MNEYCTDLKVRSGEIKWTIKKLLVHLNRYKMNVRQVALKSPVFSVGYDTGSTTWYLEVAVKYCNAKNDYFIYFDAKCVSTLYRVAWVTMYFKGSNGENLKKHFQLTQTAGLPYNCSLYYGHLTEFLNIVGIKDSDGDLTIICKIDVYDNATTSGGKSLIPKTTESHVLRDFAQLIDNEKFTDVTFIFGTKRINAHKLILMARSPVFAAMFAHPMVEQDKNEVNIDDINFDVFKKMLRYIYTGEVADLKGDAMNLLYAGDKYELEDLKEMCAASIWEEITVDNATEAYIFADRHNLKQLTELIENFIRSCISDVMESTSFKNMEKENPQLSIAILRKSLKKLPV